MALIWQPLSLIALTAAVYIGLHLPDVDQRVGFLLHRSILTHGPLLPILAFFLALGDNPVQRRLGMGMEAGYAVHLAFDLFPQAWQGYALISLPGYGWTPAIFSWIWITATMLICFSLAIKLSRNAMDSIILLIAVAATFLFAAIGESTFWRPLGVTVASVLICYWLIGPDQEKSSSRRNAALR